VGNTRSYAYDVMFHFDANLTNGVKYYYAVTASNMIAESNRTNFTPVVPVPAPHLTVSKVKDFDVPHYSLVIAWNTTKDDSRRITGYKIFLNRDYAPGPGSPIAALGANATSPVIVNGTSPYPSGFVTMVVEYDDGNISYSEPMGVEIWIM